MQRLVEPRVGGIEANESGNEITWRTFAGGRINSTIRHALGALEPNWTITHDNFTVRVRDEGITEIRFRSVAARLKSAEFWAEDAVWQQVRAALPVFA